MCLQVRCRKTTTTNTTFPNKSSSSASAGTRRPDGKTSPAPGTCWVEPSGESIHLDRILMEALLRGADPHALRYSSEVYDICKTLNINKQFNIKLFSILFYLPAIFIKCQHVALVFYTSYTVVVLVSRGKHLVNPIYVLSSLLRVLRPVIPQQRHHHFTCKKTNSHYFSSYIRFSILFILLPSSGFSHKWATLATYGSSFLLLPARRRTQSRGRTISPSECLIAG